MKRVFINGKKVKDEVHQWHVHDCTFQLVYVLNGWATFEYAGQGVRTIRKGDWVALFFGAANRDPVVFAEPDRFDLDRANVRQHLSFGHGLHFCLGAPLARLETQVALGALEVAVTQPEPSGRELFDTRGVTRTIQHSLAGGALYRIFSIYISIVII